MKFSNLQLKSLDELQKRLHEAREELRNLKFKAASGQLKEVRKIRIVRKEISQILTATIILQKK